MTLSTFIHYLSVSFCTILPSVGVSIGQGLTSQASIDAINRQPSAAKDISRTSLLALALIETSALIGFVGSFFLLANDHLTITMPIAIAELGFAFAISVPGLLLGIGSHYPAKSALYAASRQPLISPKIMRLMIISQSLMQTPLAFGFIISMLINNQINYITNLNHGIALLCSGICIAIGSIGPIIGVSWFTSNSCKAPGLNKNSYNSIISFAVISQAIIETPIIFSTIISFLITQYASSASHLPVVYISIIFIAATMTMGLGTFGAGIGSGRTAAEACTQISLNPSNYPVISRASILAQSIIDTSAIYALVIAISLILTIK